MSKLLDINVNEQLIEILEQYDVNLEQLEDYYFADGLFPGIVAQAFEMEDFGASVVVQLDITMLFPEQSFVESFVAQAESHEEALAVAFQLAVATGWLVRVIKVFSSCVSLIKSIL